MTRYKTVDTSTLDGLKRAERLHAQGWTCYRVGLFLQYYYKRQVSNA
jgi:hypothetical protein